MRAALSHAPRQLPHSTFFTCSHPQFISLPRSRQVSEFVPCLQVCASSSILRIRELSAKCLATFETSADELRDRCVDLLLKADAAAAAAAAATVVAERTASAEEQQVRNPEDVEAENLGRRQNEIHGVLLTVSERSLDLLFIFR